MQKHLVMAGEQLNIDNISTFYSPWMTLIESQNLCLDLSNTQTDSSTVAFLIHLKLKAEKCGYQLILENVPDGLVRLASLYDLDNIIPI